MNQTILTRASGVDLREAVVKVGRTRLKRVPMKSLATVLGLIPMAVGLGGEKTQATLADRSAGRCTLHSAICSQHSAIRILQSFVGAAGIEPATLRV